MEAIDGRVRPWSCTGFGRNQPRPPDVDSPHFLRVKRRAVDVKTKSRLAEVQLGMKMPCSSAFRITTELKYKSRRN